MTTDRFHEIAAQWLRENHISHEDGDIASLAGALAAARAKGWRAGMEEAAEVGNTEYDEALSNGCDADGALSCAIKAIRERIAAREKE